MTHRRLLLLLAALALSASGAAAQTTFTSVDDGDWSDPTTWDQNAVPTVGSNVVIEDYDDVVLDVDADVNDVAITENGDLYFSGTTAVTLTVRGDVTLGPNSRFRPNDRPSAGPFVRHSLLLEGDLTGVGEVDFRRGSNGSGTATGVDVTFQGDGTSTVNLTGPSSAQLLDNYALIGRANEFNSITFAKTGAGRVVLQSSIESSNNSSTGEATCDFDGGVVEVADGQALVCASSSSTTVTQGDRRLVRDRHVRPRAGQQRGDHPDVLRRRRDAGAAGHHRGGRDRRQHAVPARHARERERRRAGDELPGATSRRSPSSATTRSSTTTRAKAWTAPSRNWTSRTRTDDGVSRRQRRPASGDLRKRRLHLGRARREQPHDGRLG